MVTDAMKPCKGHLDQRQATFQIFLMALRFEEGTRSVALRENHDFSVGSEKRPVKRRIYMQSKFYNSRLANE